jgi:hypothetical protein
MRGIHKLVKDRARIMSRSTGSVFGSSDSIVSRVERSGSPPLPPGVWFHPMVVTLPMPGEARLDLIRNRLMGHSLSLAGSVPVFPVRFSPTGFTDRLLS